MNEPLILWFLVLRLVTGETITVKLPELDCRAAPVVLASGGTVRLDVNGRKVEAREAVCFKVAQDRGTEL